MSTTDDPRLTCPICCEAFTTRLRKSILCAFCGVQACSCCVRRYLTDDGGAPRAPDCMSCHRPWSLDHLDSVLPRSYVDGELMRHHVEGMYRTEVSMMPATQPAVERMLRLRRLMRDLEEARKSVVRLEAEFAAAQHTPLLAASNATYIRPCPAEGCKGFIDQQSCACGLCGVRICRDCHVVMSPCDAPGTETLVHVCNADDVASTARIAKETRPCPGCSACIFKINGCDQMFCTRCHTAFSWQTGSVDVGRVHNPHYYLWLEQRAAADNDHAADNAFNVPCGGMPQFSQVIRACRTIRRLPICARLAQVHQHMVHIEEVELRNVRDALPAHNVQRFLLERMQLMVGNMSVQTFKDHLQRSERVHQRSTAVAEVLSAFSVAGADAFRNLLFRAQEVPARPVAPVAEETLAQAGALLVYFNDQLQRVSRRFGGQVLQVMPDWTSGTYTAKGGVLRRVDKVGDEDDDDDGDYQAPMRRIGAMIALAQRVAHGARA